MKCISIAIYVYYCIFKDSKEFIEFQVYLHVSSETLEVSETEYLNVCHLLISSVNSVYISVRFIPFTTVTVSTVAVTLCIVAAVTAVTFSTVADTVLCSSSYHWL